jgi:hypothetical protein
VIDTLPAQVGAVGVVLILVFALLKGDALERIGATAYLLGWIATLMVQQDARLHGPQWGMMAIDVVMLLVFISLAWKSRRAWPVWACAFQALIVMSHVLTLVDPRPPIRAFYTVMNLASYGILTALALGAWRAWRERRALGLD